MDNKGIMHYAKVFHYFQEGVIITDISNNILYFNEKADDLLELKYKNAYKKKIDAFLHGISSKIKEKKVLLGLTYMLKNTRVSLDIIPIIKNNDKQEGYLYHIYKNGHSAGVFDFNSQTWFKNILESINDAVLIADKNKIVRYINQAYTSLKGIKKEQIIGRHVLELRPESLVPTVIDTGKAIFDLLRETGKTSYIVNITPILHKGKIVGAIAVSKDITEVKKLSEQLKRSEQTIKGLKSQIQKAKYCFNDIIGANKGLKDTVVMAKRIAAGESNVIIRGESGTGKELLAHAIHNGSPRRDHSFIAVNCASIPSNLLETELFGYDEGAFTGARKGGKVGLFELADDGTLFLDEIGDMDLFLQAKLLRVLQDKVVRRVGGTKKMEINVRLITATNKNLEKMITEGKFREDLYYRLNVIPINIPPLRERKEDIPELAEFFLEKFAQYQRRNIVLTEEALEILVNYHWPGNVRELENAMEFAVNMSLQDAILPEHLPKYLLKTISLLNKNNNYCEEQKHIHFNSRQEKIIKILQKNSMKITSSAYAKQFEIDRTTAYRDLNELVEKGFLKKMGKGRGTYYIFDA